MDLRPMSRELRKFGLDAKVDKESPIPALLFKHEGITSQVSFVPLEGEPSGYGGILFNAPCPNPFGLDEVDANDFNAENLFVTMTIEGGGVSFIRLYPFTADFVTTELFLEMVKLWLSQHPLMRRAVLGENGAPDGNRR